MPANALFLAFGLPGNTEWLVILVIGLLIFGRRLPEVGRSLGRGIVEFKRGIKGIEEEIEDESSQPSQIESKPAQHLTGESQQAETEAQVPTEAESKPAG